MCSLLAEDNRAWQTMNRGRGRTEGKTGVGEHRTCGADLEEGLLLWALGGEPQMAIRSDNMCPGWTLKG